MYFGKELEKDAPFPVNITVYQPPGLRMSPAIGTESEEVFGILRMGFDDADDAFVDVEGGNYRALRRVLIEAHSRMPNTSSLSVPIAGLMRSPGG